VPQTSRVVKLQLLLGVISFALMVFCLVQAISTPEPNIRNLRKIVWILLILFFPLVGSVAWLVAGRPENGGRLAREQGGAASFPEYERRGRMAAVDPEKDDEFLRKVRERAEQQRKRYDEERRRREQQEGEEPR
jgi:hypothetical protein